MEDYQGNEDAAKYVRQWFICKKGGIPVNEDEVKQSSVQVDVGGKCMVALQPDQPLLGIVYPKYECCPETGLCVGASCTILGGNTENGTSCDCQSCPCIYCAWAKDSCFTSNQWHKKDDLSGLYSVRQGQSCFGVVTCTPEFYGNVLQTPVECGDSRVGQFCMEDHSHFVTGQDNDEDGLDDGWYQSTQQVVNHPNQAVMWATKFKTCSLHPCNETKHCCTGQRCDTTLKPNCPKCIGSIGTCTDEEPCPDCDQGDCPCPEYLRSPECNAIAHDPEKLGWTQLDIPNCNYDLVTEEAAKYGCTKAPGDCDTWVCTVAPTAEELAILKRKLSACTPRLIEPETKPNIPDV